MRKPLFLISVLLISVATAAAATNDPHHPLSQIYPVDEGLNMSDMPVFNVSELRLRNGLQIDGTAIQDPGNVKILEWDSTNNEIDVRNGNLNLSGNQILGIGGTQCGPSEALLGDGTCGKTSDPQNLSDVLGQGNSTGSYDINLNGNRLLTGGGAVSVTDSVNNMDVARFKEGGNVAIPNGNLHLNNNTITDVGPAQDPWDAVNKSYVDTNDDTVSDNQNLQDVLSRGNSTGGYDIDMNGNSINNVNSLSTTEIPDIVPIYIRGTGLNNDANRIVEVGGNQIVNNSCRGLQLVVLFKSDYSVSHNQCYDTYGSSSDSDDLGAKLDDIGNSKIGILTSYDAWENSVTSGLDANFTRLGLYKAAQTPNIGSRRPYAAIFEGTGASEGAARATETLFTDTGTQPRAQLRGLLVEGSYVVEGSKQSNLAGNQGKNPAVTTDRYQNVQIPNGDLDMSGNNITDSTRGNVSVGDSLFVYGNVYGTGADLAEIYPSDQELEPGQLVTTAGNSEVERTGKKFEKTVGVVSLNPGYVMNSMADGYKIGLEGKIEVRLAESHGRIEAGDYIVASGEPGEAVSCETRSEMGAGNLTELKKVSRHNRLCENRALGTALEKATESEESVKVLVS